MGKRGSELWSGSSGNCVGFYQTEAAALADVVDDLHSNGRKSAEDLGLITPNKETSLSGAALVDKALASRPARKTA